MIRQLETIDQILSSIGSMIIKEGNSRYGKKQQDETLS